MISVHGVLLLPMVIYAIATCAATIVAVWMAYAMFRQLRLARWVEDTPTSKIRSAAQGLVELKGALASDGQPALRSPLSGETCLWYRFRIEEYRGNGRPGRNSGWQQVEQGISKQALLIKDDTGACLILPEGAVVHPLLRRRWEGRHRWPLSPARNKGLLNTLIGRRYRYTEERLQEGDLLYALGWFESRGGGRDATDLDQLVGQIIRSWKSDYPSLLARFGQPNSNRLGQLEWQHVRAAAIIEAKQLLRESTQKPARHVLSRPHHKRLPFVLSAYPEDYLSRRLRRQSVWRLMGFMVASSLAGWLWLALLGR